MLNRKQLPPFARLKRTIDIEALQKYCVEQGYVDYNSFDDINYSTADKHKSFLVANGFCKESFFKEEGAAFLEGENYRQLYLTDIDQSKLKTSEKVLTETDWTIFSRTRRLDPSSPHYVPEADELNYTQRNEHVAGPFADILNGFKSLVTRVRLAVLMPGFGIKPHVDYDPSYITRFHIPIFTSADIVFGMKTKDGNQVFTMPADGSIYFFNSGLVHWVDNNSSQPRLHLIVDTHGQADLEFSDV